MNKQKLTTIIAILGLLIGLMIGGTSAYFVTSERSHNVITTGGVAVELIEETNQQDTDGSPKPFENIENAFPGDCISKIPTVKNIDNGDAWVRIRILTSAKQSDGTEVAVGNDIVSLDIDSRYWLNNGDDYYYYYRPLFAGEITEPVFTEVTLEENLANEYNGAKFNLELVAQAVQTANNGDGIDVYTAEGWPEE